MVRTDVANAIDQIERIVQGQGGADGDALSIALSSLAQLQDDHDATPAVEQAAREVQHWLSQLIARAGPNRAAAQSELSRIRRLAMNACVELRTAAGTMESCSAPALSADCRQPDSIILIVDDEREVREIIGRILKRAGFRVILAADPMEARKVEEAEPCIDLLITDIALPSISGIAMTSDFRRRRPQLPVLFVSGYPVQGAIDGVADFLPKPFDADELLVKVEKILRRAAAA